MLRKSTDFTGWQNEVEYLAEEAKRQKRNEASIALYQRDQKPGMFVSGWDLLKFFGRVVLLAAGLILFCYGVVIATAAWFGL